MPAASLRFIAPSDRVFLRRGLVYSLSFLALAAAGWLTGDDGYFWAATASLWTCLADREGTWRERLLALGTVGMGGAAVSAVGSAVATFPWLALMVVVASGLSAGLAEVRGPVAALSAKLLYVVLIASCLLPVSEPDAAVRAIAAGTSFLQGGVFACLVCLVTLPCRDDRRPRPEVTAVFGALADLAANLAGATAAADATDGKREVRKCIEQARLAIAATRPRWRPRFSEPQSLFYYSYAVSLADALFALLIVALELRSRGKCAGLPVTHILRSVADAHEQVQQTLTRQTPDLPALCSALHLELKRLHAPIVNAGAPALYQAALSSLARFPRFDAWRAGFRWPRRGFRHAWQALRRAVAEHTATDTRAARHAMRLAFAGSLSLLPAQVWHVDHGYWVAVTVIMVLSPQLSTTRHSSRQRFAGSLAGALVGCAIGLAQPSAAVALALSAISLAMAYIARLYGRPGRFALFLTPAVILFTWVGQPTSDSSHFAALRGLDTAIGCLIALVSYYILAPRAELSRVYRHSLDALAVNSVYLRAAFASAETSDRSQASRALGSPHDRLASLEALRVAAGRASTLAEETLLGASADVAPGLADEYRNLHGTLRRMAALAGLVRAGLDAPGAQADAILASRRGDVPAAPATSAQTRALLTRLEARLSELAIRPGRRPSQAASLPHRSTAANHPSRDDFLEEQAAFAHAYADAAHAAVSAVQEMISSSIRGRQRPLPRPG